MMPSQSATIGKAGASRWAGRARLKIVLLLGALGLASACGLAVDDSGSNSNWLLSCEENADCGKGLSCVCGQCTTTCTANKACSNLGGTCGYPELVCGTPVNAICIAECGSDADCQNIHEELSCVSGICRVLEQPVLPAGDAGAQNLLVPNELPPGNWTTRGAPASCDTGAVTIDTSGSTPWGPIALNATWVGYTTGSTRPEFMTIVFSGTWSDGPLIVGVSISQAPMSGGQLLSNEGMEVFATRYYSWVQNAGSLPSLVSEQVEVEGTLTVDEYVAPVDPFAESAAVTLRGQLDLGSADWSLSAPFDITTVCYSSSNIIIK